jgi:hypothetical protein
MVSSRINGILAGHEGQNRHDTLRAGPVFKLLADRSANENDPASQPTLSRFENAISVRSLKRLRDVFLDQFMASFDGRPHHLTFGLDAVDAPAHGQQVTSWYGHWGQDHYLTTRQPDRGWQVTRKSLSRKDFSNGPSVG